MTAKGSASRSQDDSSPLYFSPRDLSIRWRCSRSSVDNITRRARLTRVCLGEGRNGIVRFLRTEVEAYEMERSVQG